MSKYIEKDIQEIHGLLVNKKIKPIDLVEDAINTIKENSDLNCFITLNEDEARKMALGLENIEVEKDNLLFGIPIAVKDNIVTSGLRTTCASKMLDNFILFMMLLL